MSAAAANALPLGRVLAATWQLLNQQRAALAQVLVFPLGVNLLLLAWQALAPAAAEAALPAIVLLRLAVYTVLAVNLHRLVLLGPQAVPAYGLQRPGRREFRYLGWSLFQGLVAAAVLVLASPLLAISQPLGLAIAMLAVAWCVGRCALALPSVALDQPVALANLWQWSRGAGFGLGFIVVGLPLVVALVLMPLSLSQSPLAQLLALLGSMLTVVFAVSALAVAWRVLREAPLVTAPEGPDVELEPDASRGIMELRVKGRFQTTDFGHVASADGLLAYHGRLRGLLIGLQGEAWEASSQSWQALDTLLAHLAFVRTHHEFLERVAVVGPGEWDELGPQLGKHFAHARVRVFPAQQLEAARAWAAGER